MDRQLILLAEDDEDDLFLMRRAAVKAGLANPLQVVRDGEEVLAYLKGEGVYGDRSQYPFPTLLLLDIKMPGMNGLDVLGVIRRDPQLRRLVVVFLTSSNQEQDINLAFDLQANSYLVKPGDTAAMTSILEKFKEYWLMMNQYPNCPALEAA